jgi:hypothetical protein
VKETAMPLSPAASARLRRRQRHALPHWQAELRRLDRRDALAAWAPVALFVAGTLVAAATLALAIATLAITGA